MLSSSFMVSSIFYCTIYSLTLKQIPFLLLSYSHQSEMIIWSYRIAFQHLFGLPKHVSPQEGSKVDLFHKRHNHTTQWWILRSRSGRRTFWISYRVWNICLLFTRAFWWLIKDFKSKKMTLPTRGNPSMVLSRNHEQHRQFYYVCMIWYLDEAKLWQLSVEKHISLTVNSFALTQLRSASVAHPAYCCKNTFNYSWSKRQFKKKKINNWKPHLSWIDKSHVWDFEQWQYLLLSQTREGWKRNKENVRQIVMRFICFEISHKKNESLPEKKNK